MFKRLLELVLPCIIGVMIHKRETLTKKEIAAQNAFVKKLKVHGLMTMEPVIVAIIGLVGAGKSSVARELAEHIGATIINGDDIRIELRRQGERFEKARAIAENVAINIAKRGGNVILDSDFVDNNKRASIREKTRQAGIRLVFIRVYCDFDVAIGRILTENAGEFFEKAISKWRGDKIGAIVKMREMCRRIPHHYRWVKQGGGKWVLKKFPFIIFAEIDTTNSNSWRREVKKLDRQLLTK